jgi:hypothetical protein
MILHAVYEATFACAADLALQRNEKVKVFLTRVGGGVFGNDLRFIEEAIDAARRKFYQYPIDVYMVNFRPNKNFEEIDIGLSPGGIAAAAQGDRDIPYQRQIGVDQSIPIDFRETRPLQGDRDIPYQRQIGVDQSIPIDFRETRPLQPSAIIQRYWEYESDDGSKYEYFDENISKILNLAFRKDPNDQNVVITLAIKGIPVTWKFDFVNMTQTNTKTRSIRKIRFRTLQSFI